MLRHAVEAEELHHYLGRDPEQRDRLDSAEQPCNICETWFATRREAGVDVDRDAESVVLRFPAERAGGAEPSGEDAEVIPLRTRRSAIADEDLLAGEL